MPVLLLVDGSSYLYRAFHALPDLRNAANEPTGAIRGVLAMLRRLAGEYAAQYRACVFDAKGPTFRHERFPDYKAHRPPMPDDLRAQVEPLFAAIRAEGWPLLSVAGVEADDVIGSLTAQALAQGCEVVISTGDKDLTQLVRPGVLWVNTMSDETLDSAGVEAKFGVPPERIVDYLALMGDAVDNVPGVEKCGPKTAVKWLSQYGSLENLMAHADEISGKVGENLRRHLDFLPLGRELVTVKTDVALDVDVSALAPAPRDVPTLKALYTRLAFKAWLGELEGGNAAAPAGGVARKFAPTRRFDEVLPAVREDGAHRAAYECVCCEERLAHWLDKIERAPLVALDTETTSLGVWEARLVGISFAVAPGEAAYLPLAHTGVGSEAQLPFDETLARLRPWLESDAPKVGQNLKYDAHVFAHHGIRLGGMAHDTLLASYVCESHLAHDLDKLARRHLGLATISYESLCGKGAKAIGFDAVALTDAAAYAAEDADITLRLHHHFARQMEAAPGLRRVYAEIEMPLVRVLLEMEQAGVLVDTFRLAAQSEELARRLDALERQAHELAGHPFNLGSPKQLGEVLFAEQGLPVLKKTAAGQPSTDEEVLQQLAEDFPLPRLLLEHRSLAKLKNTYTDKLPRMVLPATGRVHTRFSQATAVTGRLSSSEPNLQNIPIRTAEGRRIRTAFIAARDHRLLAADYSQIELRVMAHLSGDERLLDAFGRNEDVHRATAAEVFGCATDAVSPEQRRYAKVINFGLIYGMSAHGLAKNLGIDRTSAQRWIERYFARYPGVARYMEQAKEQVRTQGYVETVFGRRLMLPDIHASQPARRQAAERAAINAPMQGTAADLIKRAMLAVSNWLQEEKLATRMILQVHDELVLEAPQAEVARVREALPALMGGVAQLAVPLLVDVGEGENWDEAH